MRLILLFILRILFTTIRALPQAEDDTQSLSTNQIDFSNLEPISADNMGNKNDDTENSFLAYDLHPAEIDSPNPTEDFASQNPPILMDETPNENDLPTDMASDDVAHQKNPACDPKIATRDGGDDLILADTRLRCDPREDPQGSSSGGQPEPKPKPIRTPREIFRGPEHAYAGSMEDRYKCAKGYRVACCETHIKSLHLPNKTPLLGTADNCVWFPDQVCKTPGWFEICCRAIKRIYFSMDLNDYLDQGYRCLPIFVNEQGHYISQKKKT